MTWQNKGRKMSIGQFVRPKAERMILVRFDGEPKETVGKDFNGQPIDELQFPVTFWDERPVSQKYSENEAISICLSTAGDSKTLPVSSPPLLRVLVEEDEEASIMGRTFIISHTGHARDTTYKFREVKLPRQQSITRPPVEPDDSGMGGNKFTQAETEALEAQREKDKAAFKAKVKERAKKDSATKETQT